MTLEESNQLVVDYIDQVNYVARKALRRLPTRCGFRLADLVSMGNLGLVDAARRFQPGRAAFSTYAEIRINGAILDGLRASDPVFGSTQHVGWSGPSKTEDLDNEALNMTAQSEAQDAYVHGREICRHLATAVDRLTRLERLVVLLYYYDELTMKEIGRVLGVHESRVSQLHMEAVSRLRRQLRREVAA